MDFAEQLNLLKVDDDGITPMVKFVGTKVDINLNNYHKWGCPVFDLDARLQVTTTGIQKWEPRSCEGIYLGH